MVTKVRERAMLSDRVKKLRETLLEAKPRLCTERLVFLKESYHETEGEPAVIRRAKLLDKILRKMTLHIDENLIVGNQTKYRIGVNPYPEWSCKWMRKPSFTLRPGRAI